MLLHPVKTPGKALQDALIHIDRGYDGPDRCMPISQKVWSGVVELSDDELENFCKRIPKGYEKDALGTVWSVPGGFAEQLEPVRQIESRILSQLRKESGVARLPKAYDYSLLGCVGSIFHDDSHAFSDALFMVLWLQDDPVPVDLYFPETGQRVALQKGVWALFDPCLPHGVVRRGMSTVVDARRPAPRLPRLSVGAFLSLEYRKEELGMRKLMGNNWLQLQEPVEEVAKKVPVTSFFEVALHVDHRTGKASWARQGQSVQLAEV